MKDKIIIDVTAFTWFLAFGNRKRYGYYIEFTEVMVIPSSS